MGGDSFAVNQSSTYNNMQAWYVFNNSSWWHSAEGTPQWLSWYNPKALKINSLSFSVGNGGNFPDTPKNYAIQGSNDNTNWITIYENTNTATSPIPLKLNIDLKSNPNRIYKYWRYYISSFCARAFGNMRNDLEFDAQEQVTIKL